MHVADLTLTGARSQAVFDTLLRTLAEPGTVLPLPATLTAEAPRPLWLPLALADVDVRCAVIDADGGREASLEALVADACGARPAEVADADIVTYLTTPPTVDDRLDRGTALAPERGTRVGIAVGHLAVASAEAPRSPEVTRLRLSGPGVPGERLLDVTPTSGSTIAAVAPGLGQAGGTFPTGLDVWLWADDGAVAAISRSTTVTVVATDEQGVS
ncbi:MAG: phosphonate C-P lyase system protein PhnH [Actinomycetota bacterium]